MDYTIRRAAEPLGEPTADADRPLWAGADVAEITHFPWEDSGHRPAVTARVLYDDAWLAVLFRVEDRYVRAVIQEWNGSVCTDSCVEFFVAPDDNPTSNAYFNFEVNCGGTMLLHRCASTAEREAGRDNEDVTADDGATIRIATTLPKIVEPEIAEPTTWAVEYHVPWSLFAKYFDVAAPTAGTVWRGNFYKCGDRTSHPHWGSWAPVDVPKPSFHQPDFYQPLHFA